MFNFPDLSQLESLGKKLTDHMAHVEQELAAQNEKLDLILSILMDKKEAQYG